MNMPEKSNGKKGFAHYLSSDYSSAHQKMCRCRNDIEDVQATLSTKVKVPPLKAAALL